VCDLFAFRTRASSSVLCGFVYFLLVISNNAIDCLESLISDMTSDVSNWT